MFAVGLRILPACERDGGAIAQIAGGLREKFWPRGSPFSNGVNDVKAATMGL